MSLVELEHEGVLLELRAAQVLLHGVKRAEKVVGGAQRALVGVGDHRHKVDANHFKLQHSYQNLVEK